jgi:hypothetical protein
VGCRPLTCKSWRSSCQPTTAASYSDILRNSASRAASSCILSPSVFSSLAAILDGGALVSRQPASASYSDLEKQCFPRCLLLHPITKHLLFSSSNTGWRSCQPTTSASYSDLEKQCSPRCLLLHPITTKHLLFSSSNSTGIVQLALASQMGFVRD